MVTAAEGWAMAAAVAGATARAAMEQKSGSAPAEGSALVAASAEPSGPGLASRWVRIAALHVHCHVHEVGAETIRMETRHVVRML